MPKPESSITAQHVPHATGVPEFPTQQRGGGTLRGNAPGAIDANPLAPQGTATEPLGFKGSTSSHPHPRTAPTTPLTDSTPVMIRAASSGNESTGMDKSQPHSGTPDLTNVRTAADADTPLPPADTGGPKDPPKDPPPTNKPVPSPDHEPDPSDKQSKSVAHQKSSRGRQDTPDSIGRFVRALPAGRFRDLGSVYEGMLKHFEAAATTDTYAYRLSTVPNESIVDPTAIRVYESDLRPIGAFYRSALEEKRLTARETLKQTAVTAMQQPISVEEAIKTGTDFLSHAYTLVGISNKIDQATPQAPTEAISQATAAQRMAVRQAFEGIGKKKPESFREILRRETPRWMWHPIPRPDIPVAPEYASRLQEVWHGYSSQDASLLIHPDQLAQGNAPLHMALKAARTVEGEGQEDLGYTLRTSAIINILEMERTRLIPQDNRVEIPFFNYIFAAAITERGANAPKQAHFDYQAVFRETMHKTWDRLGKEIASNQPGSATDFLTRITDIYGGDLPPYLAYSLVAHANRSSTFNIVRTLRGLGQQGWSAALIEHIKEFPNRIVLTNEEVEAFAEQVRPFPEAPSSVSHDSTAAASSLMEEEDIYSFRIPLDTVAEVPESMQATITVDLENMAERATAIIRYKTNGNRRSIPITIDLSPGRNGNITLETIDREPLTGEISAKYQRLIEQTILAEKSRVEQEQKEKQRKADQLARGGNIQHANSPSKAVQETPDTMKVKTRGAAPEDMSSEFSAIPADDETRGRVSVVGMEPEIIATMLKDQRIVDLDANTIIQKVDGLVNDANDSSRSFGKRTNLKGYPRGDEIKLRQVNWIVGGGHRQLRIYFLEKAGGELEFYSIFNKTGEPQQHTYLKGLVKKLIQQADRKHKE